MRTDRIEPVMGQLSFDFAVTGDTGTKYKDRIRSRVFNLKDKKNPDLKTKVIKGYIISAPNLYVCFVNV